MIPKLQHLNPVQTRYLNFIEALKALPFKGELNPDYANRTVLSTDNSIYQVLPQGVIYPKDTDDLILLCELAAQADYREIVLSPRGGGTGTNAQSLTDGLVVDLSKHMNTILEINAEEGWVRAQTGVVKDQLNAALKPHGLFFAPELSTSNRATLGGMINTDASGQGSCMYGKTRDHVLELKTVTLGGSVINSHALEDIQFNAITEQQDKAGLIHRLVDSIHHEYGELIEQVFPPLNRCLTGYDLAHIREQDGAFNLNNILCGSEGTLGFITEAKLNVLPIPKYSALILVKYQDFNASLRDATHLMGASPASIETIDSKVLNLAMNDFIWHDVEVFFAGDDTANLQGINLVEYTADSEEELQSSIDSFIQHITVDNTDNNDNAEANDSRLGYSIAMGHEAVNKIWAMRKRAVGLLGNAKGEARPVPFVEDTAVPPEHLADFILEFREILDAYELSYGMFGHVDAGVLHVRPALDMKDPDQEKIAWEISDRVAELTHQYNGLLWGEHGKGVRSEYSPKFFGELYPQLQRIKAAFDPHNQLNPGKIATPEAGLALLNIDEVPTRGQSDKNIHVQTWDQYSDAVYCNGNGACFNWNTQDAMCPSWKVTRERIHSPKGRASLIREWLTLLSAEDKRAADDFAKPSWLSSLRHLPEKIRNTRQKQKGEYDFSHEVYDSMAGCLACKSCAGQCPIKVNVPAFRSKFLALYHTRYMRPLKDYLVGSLEYMLPWCAKVPKLYNFVMGRRLVKHLLKRVAGFVDGPSLTGISFSEHQIPTATQAYLKTLSADEKAKSVIIVQDAFTSYFETQVVIDTCKLLNKLGYRAAVAPFKANGKPLHVHGFLKTFKRAAQKNAKMLQKIGDQGFPLIGVDPSMTLTYRSEYKDALGDKTPPPVLLIQEWLVEQLENQEQKQVDSPQQFRLLPHCTEKTNATSSTSQWQAIFTRFGHTLAVAPVGCCGMSGTYGHEARNLENSKKIYDLSWREEIDSNKTSQEIIVATGYSCRSQVKREADTAVLHPVQALLEQF